MVDFHINKAYYIICTKSDSGLAYVRYKAGIIVIKIRCMYLDSLFLSFLKLVCLSACVSMCMWLYLIICVHPGPTLPHSYRWCSMGLHDYILAIAIHTTVTTSVWATHHPDGIHTLHRHSCSSCDKCLLSTLTFGCYFITLYTELPCSGVVG